MKINLLDLFSGIGGFSQGLKQAGFEIEGHYHAEIDKHANAIYKKQFPNAKLLGDVRLVHGADLGRINAITFGSPCQDFSLAGTRTGLDGSRSSLITEAIRLIDECRPDFFIWENVKGVFSSNAGADFWAIIQAFTNLGGYRLEWQLLNTAWVLPQNRERVYLIGRIAERCGADVFPLRPTSRKSNAGQERKTTGCINAGEGKSQNSNTFIIQKPKPDDCISVGTWRTHKKEGEMEGFREVKSNISPTLPARARSDGSGQTVIKIRQKPRGNNKGNDFDVCPTISSSSFQHNNHVTTDSNIRRLTEIECERLQGFADNWTAFGDYDGVIKPVSAGQRYKCVGNAVTVDIVQMVGEQILKGTNLA